MRKPFVTETVRADFQFRNPTTGAGLEGVSGVVFRVLAPGATEPAILTAVAGTTNPATGGTEAGWFYTDVPTAVPGTYRCIATCDAPTRAVAVGSFVVAPIPFPIA